MTTLSGTAQPAPAAGLARHLRGRVTEPDSPDWDTARRRDLFWALRGAGGGFALVTHLDLALARTPALFGGQLIWPVDAAPEVFGAWASWAPGLTRDTTSSAGVLQFPPLPELPEVFVAQTGPASGSPLLLAEIRHLGGAYARPPQQSGGPGAIGHTDAQFLIELVAVAPGQQADAAARGYQDTVMAALSPWTTGTTLPSFADPATDPSRLFSPVTRQRLADVKHRYDPANVICTSFPVTA